MPISGASQQRPERMGQAHFVELEFIYNTASATLAFVAPAKSWILRRELSIDTAWDGSAPTLNLGSDADNGLLIAAAALKPVGGLSFATPVYVDAETAFYLYPTHDSSTAGLARCLVEIIEVNIY